MAVRGILTCGLFGWLLLMVVSCAPPQESPILSGQLPVSVPPTAQVGHTIEVSVGPVPKSDGKSIGLVVVSANGPFTYSAIFDEYDMAYFTIPADVTGQSGYIALIIAVEDARAEASILLSSPHLPATIQLYGNRI